MSSRDSWQILSYSQRTEPWHSEIIGTIYSLKNACLYSFQSSSHIGHTNTKHHTDLTASKSTQFPKSYYTYKNILTTEDSANGWKEYL